VSQPIGDALYPNYSARPCATQHTPTLQQNCTVITIGLDNAYIQNTITE